MTETAVASELERGVFELPYVVVTYTTSTSSNTNTATTTAPALRCAVIRYQDGRACINRYYATVRVATTILGERHFCEEHLHAWKQQHAARRQ